MARSRRGRERSPLLGLGMVLGLLIVVEQRPEWVRAGVTWYFERIQAIATAALGGMFQQ